MYPVYISVKIKEINLSTHPDLYCGGYLVQIEVTQNGKRCLTELNWWFHSGTNVKMVSKEWKTRRLQWFGSWYYQRNVFQNED